MVRKFEWDLSALQVGYGWGLFTRTKAREVRSVLISEISDSEGNQSYSQLAVGYTYLKTESLCSGSSILRIKMTHSSTKS